MAEKMTRKEKLVKSLQLKKSNLLKKRQGHIDQYRSDMEEVEEKIEVINLQLKGLK